jgi:LTXXQ motif family protein
MRRGTMLMVGLLLASTAMPQTADARPLLLKMLRAGPLGAVLGGGGHYAGRRAYHRRAVASRTRPAAVAAAPAAAGVAATAGTAAATGSTNAAGTANNAQVTAPTTSGAAPTQDTSAQNANAQDNQAANSALPQRNAALATPDDEPRARAGEPARMPVPPTRLGIVGPLAWPTAYEDVIGFTLWPKEYGERLRVHGIGDVLSTAFAPSSAIAARTQQARAGDPNSAPAPTACGSVDLTANDWPIAQITTTTELNESQRATLDQFKTALSDAVSSIKSTCRDDSNLAPVERLRAMQNTLWAVHDAAQLIRAPLASFYDSLNDEQKQRFAAPAQLQAGGRTPSRIETARMCDLPQADSAMRQIDQSVRPTKAQRSSLEALQKKSFEMGQFLMASCLKPMPATPVERLDAAADRLTAVIFAASNLNMALNDFTSQLSDEQKTKLNSMVR